MSHRRVRRLVVAMALWCALAPALLPSAAHAQAWPTKPIKLLVGFAPGGGTDIVGRALGVKMADVLGQPVIIENRPGASGVIAADLVAKSPPDGYTLLVGHSNSNAIAPFVLKSVPYDPATDFTPITYIGFVPNILALNPGVPAKNVAELIVLAKAKPGVYTYASSGVGSTQHLAGEAFNLAAGTKAVHVPYKGSAQALADLVGGQIQLDFDTTSSAMAFIKGGKVKALAVMSPKRTPELPDVPTLTEAGLPGVEMTTWYGLFVTAGTPKAVVDKLYAETMKAIKDPDVQKRLVALGGEPGNATQAEFTALVKSDFDRFGKLIKDANVKLDP